MVFSGCHGTVTIPHSRNWIEDMHCSPDSSVGRATLKAECPEFNPRLNAFVYTALPLCDFGGHLESVCLSVCLSQKP